jgi:hypothetical protein
MTSQLIIKSRNPWKTWLLVALSTSVFALVCWLVYQFGYIRAGYDNESLKNIKIQLEEQIFKSEQISGSLSANLAKLKRTTNVDQLAYANVDKSVRDFQDELLELRAEVTFYRGIVSPTETESGLRIASLQFHPLGADGGYRFKLVLSQLRKNNRIIKGSARLYVEGIQGEEQKKLNLHALTMGKMSELRLRFKYFQNIEADLVLPEAFIPSRVLVDVIPQGKNHPRIKKTFDWSAITSATSTLR